MKRFVTLSLILGACFSATYAQLSQTNFEVHYGFNLGVANEDGMVKFFNPKPSWTLSGVNVFGLHTLFDQSPISIGGSDVFFVRQDFQGLFHDEANGSIPPGSNRVFMPGQLRIGTMNTSWNNFKFKIVTDPTNAPFINGMHIDHTNPNGWSYGMLMTVNNDNTTAISIRNNNLVGQPNNEVFRIDGSGEVFCARLRVLQAGNFPDYVFDDDYDLRTPDQLRTYIDANKHLPGIPSACEVEENGGFEVGEMSKALLEKIEELTLYTLDMHEKHQELEATIKDLKAQIVELQQESHD